MPKADVETDSGAESEEKQEVRKLPLVAEVLGHEGESRISVVTKLLNRYEGLESLEDHDSVNSFAKEFKSDYESDKLEDLVELLESADETIHDEYAETVDIVNSVACYASLREEVDGHIWDSMGLDESEVALGDVLRPYHASENVELEDGLYEDVRIQGDMSLWLVSNTDIKNGREHAGIEEDGIYKKFAVDVDDDTVTVYTWDNGGGDPGDYKEGFDPSETGLGLAQHLVKEAGGELEVLEPSDMDIDYVDNDADWGMKVEYRRAD